jgi:hypothetical protein
MKDPYPRGSWDPYRERWPPNPSDGAWNQSRDQSPYSDYFGGQSSSPSYDWQRAVTPHRPRSIQAAAVLMYVAAGLSGLSLVYYLIGNYWVRLIRGAPGLNNVATGVPSIGSVFGSVLGIAVSVLVIVLWLRMALATSAGNSWARTAATVWLGYGTLTTAVFLLSIRSDFHLGPAGRPLSTATLVAVLSALGFWVLRLTIVVLLWTKESSAYFGAEGAGWGGKRFRSDRNQVPDGRPYQIAPGVWRFGPDASSGYQRGVRPGGNIMKWVAIGVPALAVLAGTWVVAHRPANVNAARGTPVTATITIAGLGATWAPPPLGAAPAMTAAQAWLQWSHQGEGVPPTVQLGLITQPIGPCGPNCGGLVQNGIAYRALKLLAYGYYWTSCEPGTTSDTSCRNWIFLDANTGKVVTGASFDSLGLYARYGS